jgi:hypothetical protein
MGGPPGGRKGAGAMGLKVLIGLAAIVVAACVVVATRPSEFRVSRSAAMRAPAPVVFEQVNDFRKWEAWSPYVKRDPAMKKGFEGPPSGVGAVYTWSGNREVGAGRTTIVESRPPDLIRVQLEFERPFQGTSTAEFRFEPAGDQTRVTWTLDGRNGFMGKAVGLVVDLDRMVGGDFEKGLADLKNVVEARRP